MNRQPFFALVSALTSCSVLVSAVAGERTVTKSVRRTAAAADSAPIPGSGPPLRIRQLTGDLALPRAVEIALRQNPEILRAIQEIERTRGQIIEVRAAALPHITLTGTYDQQDRRLLQSGGGGGSSGGSFNSGDFSSGGGSGGSSSGGSSNGNGSAGGSGSNSTSNNATGTVAGDEQSADLAKLLQQLGSSFGSGGNSGGGGIQNKSWRVAVEVRQALYTGGQITAALAIARFAQDTAYFQLRDVVDRIISTTRQQFYNVLLTRALITVSEEAVRLAEQQLQDQRNRFEAGTVPRFNVLRAEVELANEQPNLIRARNDYLLAQLQLAKTLGLEPGPGGKPTFHCVGELIMSGRRLSLEQALGLARARRPSLKVQRQQILIDTQQINIEMAGYKPRLDANAGYEIRNDRTTTELDKEVNGWFFGFTGSWDIFDGFETYGRVKQARARLSQSKITYDDAVRQVELEVQTAFAQLEQARQTVESQRKNVESAVEALRLAQERFSAGAGTQLEILDARVALTRARTTELQARSDYNTALAEFDRATATDTVYDDTFKDPLAKVEKGIFARLAETALPKFRGDRPVRELPRKSNR